MRFAGRFSRRLHKYAEVRGIPLKHCDRHDRKHEIARAYLPADPTFQGVFWIQALAIEEGRGGTGASSARLTPHPRLC